MEIIGQIQTYAWGKIGSSSLVAQLYKKHTTINEETPYAELWIGTHPNGSSVCKDFQLSLLEIISQQRSVLGNSGYYFNYEGLPFLLKVLSIRKALSIQVHPDKDMATLLHQNFKALYPDGNHKPEMAVALTEFRALSGFRPLPEIKRFFENVVELEMVITPHLIDNFIKKPSGLLLNKLLFSLLTKEGHLVNEAVSNFLARYENEGEEEKNLMKYSLVKDLYEQFPGDSGIFMVFFLNDIHLNPGEALYIPAGLPHAYIYGDCVECMASSDNVVRAGLTPKYKDIDTLLKILDYKSYTENGVKIKPNHLSPRSTRYNPPIPEFGVLKLSLLPGESWASPCHDSCQVFIVIEGEGTCEGPKFTPFQEPVRFVAPKIVEDDTSMNKHQAENDYKIDQAEEIPSERIIHGIKEMGARESYRLHEFYYQPPCISHNLPSQIDIDDILQGNEDKVEKTLPISKTEKVPNILGNIESELFSQEAKKDIFDKSGENPRTDDMNSDSSSDSTIIGDQSELGTWSLEPGSIMFFPPDAVFIIECHKSPLLIFFAYTNSNHTYPKFPHPNLLSSSTELTNKDFLDSNSS